MALNKNIDVFIVHIHSLSLGLKMTIYLARKAPIALLMVKKVTVLVKYSDFANVFLKESAKVLSEQIRANKYVIKLDESKQPPYSPIYSLKQVEIET